MNQTFSTTLGKALTKDELKNTVGGLLADPQCYTGWHCSDGSQSGEQSGACAATACGGGVIRCTGD
ncbi:hypothetical protein [Hymenobacter convexus]|uniref:hypothetical protein n=1 Tax=Hymenobacter sp. CA1UV-4 TaxID=3063782 RepID=UPI0027141C5C|nr:hypothetical protein [Hymenobacter sp. CA1UV-4]MDO7851836.1 hypothetical protein [Hymenobacter sp. CA1UV-4]